jgi:hypothetical protein
MADTDNTQSDSWKDLAAKWLFGQSVPTVLLVLILVGGFYGAKVLIPEHLHEIQTGYERITTQVTGDLYKTSQAFDKEQERTFQLLNRMEDRRAGIAPKDSRDIKDGKEAR